MTSVEKEAETRKKATAVKVESIRAFIYDVAPKIAEETFASVSNYNRITTLMIEERSYSISLIEKTLLAIADTLVSNDTTALHHIAKEFACLRSQSGMPVEILLERIRLLRKHLLTTSRAEAITGNDIFHEWEKYYQFEIRIYEYVDIILEAYTNTYLGTLRQRPDEGLGQGILAENSRLLEVAEQALLDIVVKSTDIGLLLIDKNLRICDVNDAFEQLLHMDNGQLVGKHIEESFPSREEQRFLQWAVEREEMGHYVTERNGKWITFSTNPVYLDGKLWGAAAVVRGISQNKQFEEELLRREALAAVGQLAAGLAHEIRNPLTSIKGFIQLMREQLQTERAYIYVSVILEEIERIEGLINDVLVLARFRDDKITLERFNLTDEVYAVIRLLEPEANRCGISFHCQVKNGDYWVFGQRARIKQVLLNVCKNAMDALGESGSVVQIQLEQTDAQVILTIEDDGPGLSEEVKENLFAPFFTTKQEGTGLGLSTTRSIVLEHQGEIRATNSASLGGACFEIRLPLSKE